MNPLPEVAVEPEVSPLEAFSGNIRPTRTGLLYSAGLAVVAVAMVLLPLVYIALIGLTAWLVFLHLTHNTWIMGGSGGGLIKMILYLGPAAAGVILLFFMVKPFFARRPQPPEPVRLDPAGERLLFEFVSRICGLVGASVPCRIDVDCQVNASASLRRGLLSRDLVLTVGLPLVAGLNQRQFAGVLAHEFGHFAQGAGMRLTYIIRRINYWFARVVYERDQWDLQLEAAARGSDWRLAIVLQLSRGCVWVTRRILWVLMQAGNAISCFMLRQMEYDADSYEAKVAGSTAFEQTAGRLRVLSAATQTAYQDVQQCWASKRLPEDLPLLIRHKAGTLPAELQQKLAETTQQTGWFDTHPCDADRVAAARRLNEPGVFQREEPAAALFADFAGLSRTVTRHQYQKHFELEFSEANLMPAEEILRESEASARTDALVRKYFGEVNLGLLPLFTTPGWDPADAGADWEASCQAMSAQLPEAVKLSGECAALDERILALSTAYRLARAGFRVEPAEFGLPAEINTPGLQETECLRGLEECSKAFQEKLGELEPFFVALRRRVTAALKNDGAAAGDSGQGGGEQGDAESWVRLLAAVAAELPRARQLGRNLRGYLLLAQNRGNHASPGRVDSALGQMATEFNAVIAGMQERLGAYEYPFAHVRGRVSVAAYAAHEKTEPNPVAQAYMNASAHVDRLFMLHYRLVGEVLALAERVES